MASILCKMDAKLLGFIEKGARAFQRRFHRTNFWLCRWCFAFSVFFGLPSMSAMIRGHIRGSTTIMFIIVFLYSSWYMFVYFNTLWKTDEDRALARLVRGTANPRKYSQYSILVRLLLSLIFLLATVNIVLLSFIPDTTKDIGVLAGASVTFVIVTIALEVFMLILGAYLIACDPLPPAAEYEKKDNRAFQTV